jgi:hypothetical protein
MNRRTMLCVAASAFAGRAAPRRTAQVAARLADGWTSPARTHADWCELARSLARFELGSPWRPADPRPLAITFNAETTLVYQIVGAGRVSDLHRTEFDRLARAGRRVFGSGISRAGSRAAYMIFCGHPTVPSVAPSRAFFGSFPPGPPARKTGGLALTFARSMK